MGSLTSRPPTPQPLPPLTAPPISTAAAPVSPLPTTAPDTSEETAQARRSGLLQRDRSRFGTIATSFRGLLSQNTNNAPRKTLLGE